MDDRAGEILHRNRTPSVTSPSKATGDGSKEGSRRPSTRAVNHPFQQNLGPDGRFLPPAELARRWRAALGSHGASETLCMCGSGVTACHNLLALEVAGLGQARLYPGSWSEWIRDPARPVAPQR